MNELEQEHSAQRVDSELSKFSPRSGCAVSLIVALVGVALVTFVLALATSKEIKIGSDAPNLRIWIVNDSQNQGLGISTTLKTSDKPADGNGFLSGDRGSILFLAGIR